MTNATCPFYAEAFRTVESREIRSDGQSERYRQMQPYCTHPDSPCPKRMTFKVIGAGLLRCGGKLDQCQIPGGPSVSAP